MSKGISFSGHRKAPFDWDSPAGHKVVERLCSQIVQAVGEGFDTFYTGMAMGFDLIAAEAVIRERDARFGHIRLICVIPHKGQEAAWNRRWRGRFNEVLIHADDHEYLHDEYITGCFHERNRVLVNSCQRLICFDSGRAGGTRHTVEYAQEQGVEIVNIWEEAEVWA